MSGGMSKYHAIPTVVGGIRFDSKAEARRWGELLLLQKSKQIRELERQTKFVIIPKSQYGRELYYKDDFTYFDVQKKVWVYEDVKGVKTPVYKLKKRLVAERYGIVITEIS